MKKLTPLQISFAVCSFLTIASFCTYLYLVPANKPIAPARENSQHDTNETADTDSLEVFQEIEPSSAPMQMEEDYLEQTLPPSEQVSRFPTPVAERPLPTIFWGHLKLIDTIFFGHNAPQNRAVIKDRITAREASYPLSAILPYGSKLVKIMKDRITIEKDGKKRSLKLSVSLNNPSVRKTLSTKGYQQVTQTEWLIRPNRLLKDDKNISDILQALEIIPIIIGSVQGFQVNKLEEGSILEDLGVIEGDTIKAINGQKITNLNNLIQAYKKAQQSPMITIKIDRDNQPIELSYWIVPDGKPSYNIEKILTSSIFPGFK